MFVGWPRALRPGLSFCVATRWLFAWGRSPATRDIRELSCRVFALAINVGTVSRLKQKRQRHLVDTRKILRQFRSFSADGLGDFLVLW